MITVNGKAYPLWSQFVEREEEFIGSILEDLDEGGSMKTIITGITLKPNGKNSAFFRVNGKEFSCGFDVGVGGIIGGEKGWLTFCGYSGHIWRIKK